MSCRAEYVRFSLHGTICSLFSWSRFQKGAFLLRIFPKGASFPFAGTLGARIHRRFLPCELAFLQYIRLVMKQAEESNSPLSEEGTTGKEAAKRKSTELGESESRGKRKRQRGGGGKLRAGERYVPPPQKRKPGVSFSQEHFDETSYYFEGGLRKVRPYYFDFRTYCKGRWIGRSLLDVFSTEFLSDPIEYYQKAAKVGRIRLNETPIEDLSVVLRDNDLMRNTMHRHEPPVVGKPIKVLVDDGEVLVVDKPPSIPVHPCGRFRHNTVIFILGKELGLRELHTVHRLDRLTSGVLLFARTLEVCQKLDQLVRDRKLEKEYICRVEGEFPEGELICEEPILVASYKNGLCRVDPKGKESRTVFQRLSFNGKSSIVRCLPLTGRTHQIRVHLQYLGCPIINDPIYGSSRWNSPRRKGFFMGKTNEELLQALVDEQTQERLSPLDIPDNGIGLGPEVGKDHSDGACEADEGEETRQTQEDGGVLQLEAVVGCSSRSEAVTEASQSCNNSTLEESQHPSPSNSNGNEEEKTAYSDPLCRECKLVRPDPTAKELIMYLHALRYKGPDFEYSSPLPDWAKEDWVETE